MIFNRDKLEKMVEMYRTLGGENPCRPNGSSQGEELCLLCKNDNNKDGYKKSRYYIGCDCFFESVFEEICTLKEYEEQKPTLSFIANFGFSTLPSVEFTIGNGESLTTISPETPLHKEFKWCRVPRKGDIVMANFRCADNVYRPRKCRVLETGEKYDAYGEFVVVCIEKGSKEETDVQWIDEYTICDQ